MPLRNTTLTTPGVVYGRPFDGPVDFFAQGVIDVTALDNVSVDADGYIVPGLLLAQGAVGVFAPIGPGDTAFGIVPEPIKVAAGNDAASLAAASTTFPLGIATICQVRRGIMEDNLGRALTADEVASCVKAGANVTLLG